jgi:hypothetical protein
MIRFFFEEKWVIANYYIHNEKYVVTIKDWYGIQPHTILLSKEEFLIKTETIKERNV